MSLTEHLRDWEVREVGLNLEGHRERCLPTPHLSGGVGGVVESRQGRREVRELQ